MEEELINIYINSLIEEINEINKKRIIAESQVKYLNLKYETLKRELDSKNEEKCNNE
jgi:hypothetical protein